MMVCGLILIIDSGSYANYCGDSVSCTCAQILQYQLSTYNENCQASTCKFDSANQSLACFNANKLGCGTYYPWSNSTANVLNNNTTTTNYCSEN